MKEKFYITTAIAYSSRKPHIGNVYEAVLADAIARYKRVRTNMVRRYSRRQKRQAFRRRNMWIRSPARSKISGIFSE